MNAQRAVGSLLARHILGFTINFVGTVILVRHFGPVVWGVYSVAYAVQFIAQGIIERGTAGYLIQRHDPPNDQVLGTAFSVQLVTGAVTAAAVALTAPGVAFVFQSEALTGLLWAVAISLAAYALRAVPLGMLERSISYRRVGAVEVADVITFNAVAVIGVALGFGMASLAIAAVTRAIVSLALAWPLSRLMLRPRFSSAVLKELVTFAIPYTGSNALAYLNGAAAPLLVGTIAGARAFGVLQLAYSLIAYPQVLNGILGRVAFPVYSRMTSDARQLQESVGRATSALIQYMGTATLAVAASSPLWVPTIYGPAWVDMPQIMMTIAPALGLGTAFTFVIAGLNATGRAKLVLVVGIAFSSLYWTAAAILVPLLGALGLPVAYSLASITFALYLLLFRRTVGVVDLRVVLIDFTLVSLGVLAAAWTIESGAHVAVLVAAAGFIVLWPLRRLDVRRTAEDLTQLLSAMVRRP